MSQSVLLQIARNSIMEVFQAQRLIDRDALLAENPILATPMATFVTLHLNQDVRGCMGSLSQERTLLEDIIHNAKMAAFQDPRFEPLSTSEYLHTAIELSLLTKPKQILYSSLPELKVKIRPEIDGVILHLGDKAANFLPQAWQEYKTFDLFFSALCQQAGLSIEAVQKDASIYSYQVESAYDKSIIK